MGDEPSVELTIEAVSIDNTSFPEPLGSTPTQNNEIHTDVTTGKRYSYDQTTGKTEWLPAETISSPNVASSRNVDDGQPKKQRRNSRRLSAVMKSRRLSTSAQIMTDGTSGKRYSYNTRTGETDWLPDKESSAELSIAAGQDDDVEHLTCATTGKRYSHNLQTGATEWLP